MNIPALKEAVARLDRAEAGMADMAKQFGAFDDEMSQWEKGVPKGCELANFRCWRNGGTLAGQFVSNPQSTLRLFENGLQTMAVSANFSWEAKSKHPEIITAAAKLAERGGPLLTGARAAILELDAALAAIITAIKSFREAVAKAVLAKRAAVIEEIVAALKPFNDDDARSRNLAASCSRPGVIAKQAEHFEAHVGFDPHSSGLFVRTAGAPMPVRDFVDQLIAKALPFAK